MAAWNLDIPLCLALVAALVVHARGRRGRRALAAPGVRRRRSSTLAVALVSPLDALSSSLASAHMVQHLLLTVVAAPLLVVSTPIPPSCAASPVRSAATRGPRLRRVRPATSSVG